MNMDGLKLSSSHVRCFKTLAYIFCIMWSKQNEMSGFASSHLRWVVRCNPPYPSISNMPNIATSRRDPIWLDNQLTGHHWCQHPMGDKHKGQIPQPKWTDSTTRQVRNNTACHVLLQNLVVYVVSPGCTKYWNAPLNGLAQMLRIGKWEWHLKVSMQHIRHPGVHLAETSSSECWVEWLHLLYVALYSTCS